MLRNMRRFPLNNRQPSFCSPLPHSSIINCRGAFSQPLNRTFLPELSPTPSPKRFLSTGIAERTHNERQQGNEQDVKQHNPSNRRLFGVLGGVSFVAAAVAVIASEQSESEGPTTHSSIDTTDTKNIFAKKSTSELIFSLFILKLCSIDILTKYGPGILELAEKLHCATPIYWIIKKTFFKQFCAGEDFDETLQVVDKLYQTGLSSILDYSVESGHGTNEEFDNHTRTILQTIEFSGQYREKAPFSCLKVSGLTFHSLLERMSTLLSYQAAHPEYKLSWKEAIEQDKPIHNNNNVIMSNNNSNNNNNAPAPLTEMELQQLKELYIRLDTLCKFAAEQKVAMLFDAEQTYYQPAITFLAIKMCQKYNKKQAIIHNTYQMYLKDGLQELKQHIAAAKRDKYYLGAKLVRGAYMDGENERAKQLNQPSPICATIDETHQSYNNGIGLLMDNIQHVSFMIATHNEDSVKLAFEKMKEKQIPANHPHAHFGQLFGMCDQLSYAAANQGLAVSKYVPFGPVKYVIPYLVRRMQENKGFVARTVVERQLISKEIRRRLLG